MSEPKLVTCIVSADGQVTWASDQRTPRDFNALGLTEAVKRAATEIGALYAGKAAATETELQFAIYPFEDSASTILDIAPTEDGYTASDLAGKGLRFQARSLEQLVEAIRSSLGENNDAMLRWIIPVHELPLPEWRWQT